ncbi:MAG: tyrosine-type recombinase/integrase, partial [Alphaproteobacteria bacterium]|nr:tyrosine-type recombinase/integrase [Alphaproteobacteria bacterium]
PSPKPGRHMEHLVQAAKRIREEAGVEFVPHDLRRTAASYMTSMGIPRLTVKKILNHVETDVTATYDRHSYDQEKCQALNAWGQRLHEIISGQSVGDGKVIRLGAARQ